MIIFQKLKRSVQSRESSNMYHNEVFIDIIINYDIEQSNVTYADYSVNDLNRCFMSINSIVRVLRLHLRLRLGREW